MDFSEFLVEWGFDDEEDDDNYDRDKMDRAEDRAYNIRLAMSQLSKYFTEWINSITLKDIIQKSDFKNLIDTKNDLFLTFNYTSTLESIYNCCNVLHIHGKIGENLLFGHGGDDFD